MRSFDEELHNHRLMSTFATRALEPSSTMLGESRVAADRLNGVVLLGHFPVALVLAWIYGGWGTAIGFGASLSLGIFLLTRAGAGKPFTRIAVGLSYMLYSALFIQLAHGLIEMHFQGAGFVTTVRDTTDMTTVKASMGVPKALESCHTARIGSYVIEGHVPADVIVKLLQTKPLALGLAVPGMPMGSPGMEGGKPDKYDIMLFDKTGKSRVFASR